MVRKLSLAIAMALSVTPIGVGALGLGDIHLKSALNQSLNADIELLSVEGEEIADIRVKLASAGAFKQAGIERPHSLVALKFKPERRPDGSTVIRVTSGKPVREPFLDFLIEVDWPKGRLVREYTVLLDPPATLDRSPAPITRPEIAAAPRRRSAVKAVQSATAPDSRRVVAGEYGPTRRNDTLWSIAKRVRQPGASIEQMMMALFNANPRAFIDRNINKLKIGEVLQVPAHEEVMALTPGEARRAFYAQVNGQPVGGREQPEEPSEAPAAELKIASASPRGKGEAGTAEGEVQAETPDRLREDLIASQEERLSALEEGLALKSRVEELQVQLEQMQRLLTLKNGELARFQVGTAGGAEQDQPKPEPQVELELQAELEPQAEPEPQAELEPQAEPKPVESPDEAADLVVDEKSAPALDSEQIELDIMDDGEDAAESEKIFLDEEAAGTVAEQATPPVVEKAEPAIAAPSAKPVQSEPSVAEKPKAETVPKPKKEQTLLQRIAGDTTLIGVAVAVVLVVLSLIWVVFRRRRSAREEFRESILVDTLEGRPEASPEEALEPTPPATEETSFLSDFSPSDIDVLQEETGEVDPLGEADVYIAYGRYKQAEELMRQAIKRDPQRMDLKLKLLEILFATRDAEAYTTLAQQMVDQGIQQNDPKGWERAITMGAKLAPASALFAAAGNMAAMAGSGNSTALEDGLPGGRGLGAGDQPGTSEKSDALGSLDDLDLDLDLGELDELVSLGDEGLTDGRAINFDPDGSDQAGGPIAADDDTLSDLEAFTLGSESLADMDLGSEDQARDDMVLGLDDLEETVQGGQLNDLELEESLNISLDELESASGIGGQDTALEEPQIDLSSAMGELDDTTLESLEQELGLPDNSELPLPEEVMVGDGVGTKLDLAQAYVEMGDAEGARSILDEVLAEGNESQKQEAQKMLGQLS